MTDPAPLQQIDRTFVRVGKRRLSYFSGCDYFRLASHPNVQAAMQIGLRKFGLNVAASRLTTGNHVVYAQLEKELASFFKTEAALLVSTGYLTNLIVAQALAGSFSHVLLDEKAHPSLGDAAHLFDCPVLRFKSCDVQDALSAAKRCGPGSRLILLTDGMFARDGSAAPLREYVKLLPRDARFLVDDAHGAGVLGKSGRGTPEHSEVDRRRVIQTVTLSKAFGTYGGTILCDRALRQKILDGSHMFIGSTPLPLPLANAAFCAVRILKTNSNLRQRLYRNSDYVKNALRKRGFPLPDAPGPIICLPELSARANRDLTNALLNANIYPPFIKYPGGPVNGYFRFVISSEHSRKQLDNLLEVLRSAQFGVS
jgi:glycine C-acetyltransferase/8-amino-7-oxononanoate synthase